MDNPIRTAAHIARVTQRRQNLKEQLASLFPKPTSIVWEVGCGHGHFLAAFAAAHPEQICVGVDISVDRIRRATRKRDRAKLANLHFINAEARDFLDSLPESVTFTAIYVLFPDPWPKRRHHKNRIMQPGFLSVVAGRSTAETRLHFRTDFEPYFRDTELVIREHPAWKQVGEPWPFEQETVFQSRAPIHHSLTAVCRVGR
ncbi:MAG TPA: tRNA (guanosine(46)-N7)-methyltransferase TrmB [Opitutaceae bacterium]|nr:tRNA (guanosine(46)-N7)-methyltransferase TrmB [Opitutaceae bacterium]HND62256.1 tRNA (guanosine(46)-N7)-methyltransferase TrmB [Opitutaceae bacterium]